MSKFCQYCGTKMEETDTFCPQCGKKAPPAVSQPQSSGPAQASPRINPASAQVPPQTNPTFTQVPPQVNPAFAKTPPRVNQAASFPPAGPAAQGEDKSKLYLIIGALAALLIGGGLYMLLSGGQAKTASLPAPAAKTETTAKPGSNNAAASQPAAPASSKTAPEVKTYIATLQKFETRLGNFADRINSGTEDASALKAVGNVLKDDIYAEQNNLRKLPDQQDTQQLGLLLKIQWKRADCMVRGLAGVPGAYAEGGGYYDEFQAKFAKFRQSHGA